MAQHDYIIANQSGASFRADLNNGLAAVVSQNSGAAEPSTTYAYMAWADTTTGLYKIRNGANSAWIPLYKLDGTGFSVANGGYLRLADNDSSNYVGLQAPSTVSSNVVFTLPGADGAAGLPLKTDGAGGLTFGTLGAAAMASGLVLKVQHFTDAGGTTASTTLVSANTASFSYTPVSTNSTLLLLASFQLTTSFAAVNLTSSVAIGNNSASTGAYAFAANTSTGSASHVAPITMQATVSNTSTSARLFQMLHAVDNASGFTKTESIRFTVIEVAN